MIEVILPLKESEVNGDFHSRKAHTADKESRRFSGFWPCLSWMAIEAQRLETFCLVARRFLHHSQKCRGER